MWPVLAAGAVLAHGAIHGSFLSPAPPPPTDGRGPQWPFALDDSWLLRSFDVRPELRCRLGRGLTIAVVAASTVAAALLLFEAPAWRPALVVAAGLSALQLLAWFHPWLSLGLVIDAALIAIGVGWWTLGWLPS